MTRSDLIKGHLFPSILMLSMAGGTSGCLTKMQSAPEPVRPRVTTSQTFAPMNYGSIGLYIERLSSAYVNDGILRAVEDEFMRQVMEKGFVLAARSDIERVLREQRLQTSGITEEAIARAGRALNVPAIMIVTVNNVSTARRNPPSLYNPSLVYYRSMANVSARLVDTERAEVLWISSYEGGYSWDSSDGNERDLEGRSVRYAASVVASGLPYRRGSR